VNLAPIFKAVAVTGFNVGVEVAQLAVMGAAFPRLMVSRWRLFHALRPA
jgi:hypothetical protein